MPLQDEDAMRRLQLGPVGLSFSYQMCSALPLLLLNPSPNSKFNTAVDGDGRVKPKGKGRYKESREESLRRKVEKLPGLRESGESVGGEDGETAQSPGFLAVSGR